MPAYWKTIHRDLLQLFFPRLCPACGEAGLPDGMLLCLECQIHLSVTQQHLSPDNSFTRRFWGRLPLIHGSAMFSFHKGGRVPQLLHHIKYRNRPDLAVYLGSWYGQVLAKLPVFQEAALILPVPLHPRKQRERGYNQSACFAEGLSDSLAIPWSDRLLLRRQYTATQTHKTRFERFENVAEAFELPNPSALEGKTLILTDDVLTTGATLEACGTLLLLIPKTRLILITLAMAAE